MTMTTIIIRETHWQQTDRLLKLLTAKDILKVLNLKPHHATLIECTTCQQLPDQPCKTRTGKTAHTPHNERIRTLIASAHAHDDNNYTIHEQPTYHDLTHPHTPSDEVASAKI